jgi:hypothetical protein
MAQIISRLFSSSTNAAAAVKDVLDYRFGENEVFTIEGGAGSSHDDLVAQIVQAGIARDDAPAYADKLKGGASLIVVHAPFGSARKATVLLDRHQPLLSVVASAPAPEGIRYDRKAPLSSLFQWKPLLSDPTPFSSFFRWPTISPFSLSRARGFAELSDNVSPLSKALKWPLLTEDAAPLSQKMKWRLLSDDSAPLSRRMNWSTLSNNPSPLSTLLGVQVLSKGR